MNCKSLRTWYEASLQDGVNFRADSAEADQHLTGQYLADQRLADRHLADCPECRHFIETQRELRAGFKLLRESAPRPDSSFDAAVLDKYHQLTSRRTALPAKPPAKAPGT